MHWLANHAQCSWVATVLTGELLQHATLKYQVLGYCTVLANDHVGSTAPHNGEGAVSVVFCHEGSDEVQTYEARLLLELQGTFHKLQSCPLCFIIMHDAMLAKAYLQARITIPGCAIQVSEQVLCCQMRC